MADRGDQGLAPVRADAPGGELVVELAELKTRLVAVINAQLEAQQALRRAILGLPDGEATTEQAEMNVDELPVEEARSMLKELLQLNKELKGDVRRAASSMAVASEREQTLSAQLGDLRAEMEGFDANLCLRNLNAALQGHMKGSLED